MTLRVLALPSRGWVTSRLASGGARLAVAALGSYHANHVMKKYLTVLMALFLALGLQARIHQAWSYAALNGKATLIVIATPTKVTATPERTALPNIRTVHNDGTKEDVIGAGVETTF